MRSKSAVDCLPISILKQCGTCNGCKTALFDGRVCVSRKIPLTFSRQRGPTLFAFAFCIAFALVLLMAWTLRINPSCAQLSANATRIDVWAGTIQLRALELIAVVRSNQANNVCPGLDGNTGATIRDFVI